MGANESGKPQNDQTVEIEVRAVTLLAVHSRKREIKARAAKPLALHQTGP